MGQVFVVGSGDCGQLGLGPDIFEKERPGKIEYFDDKNIVALFAGGMHNIALSSDGKVVFIIYNICNSWLVVLLGM